MNCVSLFVIVKHCEFWDLFDRNSAGRNHIIVLNTFVWYGSTTGNFIKSPQYTGGDFMFLYRFIRRRRRRRPQILVHAITFEQLFGFLSFLAQLLALTYRLPD